MYSLKYTVKFDASKVRTKILVQRQRKAREAIRFFIERAMALAPVDSGDLRDSIGAIPSADYMTYRVVVKMPYAGFVEFGYTHRSGKWIAPNPFLRTAAAETRERYPFMDIKVVPMKRAA